MEQNVVYLHGEPTAVGHFIRVGTSGHRQLETLLSAEKLPFRRFVFEGGSASRQRDLLYALKERGAEIILDPNIAELSSVGRYSGAVSGAPWANPNAILTPQDLLRSPNRDIVGQIARFAVQEGFDAVAAPTHLLRHSTDPLFESDVRATGALRAVLDEAGGRHIGIDYPLIIKMASLRDPMQRRGFIARLQDTTFDNLWLRISGFGSDATPAALRKYIAAAMDFHQLARPVVADGVGGLVASALAAFGVAGGISHGVAERERFDASEWHKPPKDGGGGGREKRVLITGLDRLLSIKQMDLLMAVPTARRHFSCNDPSCCPSGLDDMLKQPKAHYLRQRFKQSDDLSRVPDLVRPRHFIDQHLSPLVRTAKQSAKLKIVDDGLRNYLERNVERLETMQSVLVPLEASLSGTTRSVAPVRRVHPASAAASRVR